MSVRAQAASRRYVIDDDWLQEYGENGENPDRSKYVDLYEISTEPENSQYLTDLIAMGKNIDRAQEQLKASFLSNGIRVGDDDDGPYIEGILEDESPAWRNKNKYVGGINHPERYRRIWAYRTTARHIQFCGYLTQTR